MTIESVIAHDDDIEDAEHTLIVLERAEQLHQANAGAEWQPDNAEGPGVYEAGYDHEDSEDPDEESPESAAETGDEEEYETPDDAADVSQGIDFDSLTHEFAQSGALSEETLTSLEYAGIPREIVQVHIEGLQARAELTQYKIESAMGGSENFQAVLQWAGQALPEADINRINGMVAMGDFDSYLLAMDGVRARFEAAFGSLEGQPLQGDTLSVTDIYQSQEEMKADMRDPRYQRDEAFRAAVAAKVARTRRGR